MCDYKNKSIDELTELLLIMGDALINLKATILGLELESNIMMLDKNKAKELCESLEPGEHISIDECYILKLLDDEMLAIKSPKLDNESFYTTIENLEQHNYDELHKNNFRVLKTPRD